MKETNQPQKNQIGQDITIKPGIATLLRDEADKNPVFKDLCHVLALRERSRNKLTVKSMVFSMQKEGFAYTAKDFQNVLLFLASVGIGVIEKDIHGNVRSLSKIKYVLQNLGMIALNKQPLMRSIDKTVKAPPLGLPKPVNAEKKMDKTKVEVRIFDRVLFMDMTPEQAARFLVELLEKSLK